MKWSWDRFGEGLYAGFFVVAFAFIVLWAVWQWGHQAGWNDGLHEYMRQDGGIWMSVTIGDKKLEGYMR